MSAEPREAAFHESGHCNVARRDVGRIVDWMHIYRDDYGWGGTTHIDPDFQNLLSWTTIAVAGTVAEAKADAIHRFSSDERLQINDSLADILKEYVDAVLLADKKRQKINP